MITINENTKLATILKQHPGALNVIVNISSKFEKLRNPILRKLMAGRTSIAMASKIGGCTLNDFFEKLQTLGFEVNNATNIVEKDEIKQLPDFLKNIKQDQIVELDVRPVIEGGKDPLNIILEKIKYLQPGQILKITNTFEPTPLILLLNKQGFESYADVIHDDLVLTYFFKRDEIKFTEPSIKNDASIGWDTVMQRFEGKLKTIDVTKMEMPLPMHTILDSLKDLPDDNALFVYHKRIPVYLLPELAERKFDYRIKEIKDGEVHLLIFKNENVCCNQ